MGILALAATFFSIRPPSTVCYLIKNGERKDAGILNGRMGKFFTLKIIFWG